MGWFSKVLGIDARKNAQRQAAEEAKKAEAARQEAARVQAETAEAQRKYQQSMLNMQNESQKLSLTNKQDMSTDVANVVAGGTADAVGTDLKKKRQQIGAGIAASLGINI